VIDLPIWLVVTFLILAMFVPLTLNMVDDLENDSAASAARSEAEKIEDSVKRSYYSGIGSIDTVSVSISGGSCLILGGEGSDSYCISVLLDDTVAEKIYLQRPSVKFLGEPLYVMGERTLSVECVIEDGTYGVKVSVID
jgi:hypothetical protein